MRNVPSASRHAWPRDESRYTLQCRAVAPPAPHRRARARRLHRHPSWEE